MVSGELGGGAGRDAGLAGGAVGARVAWDGGAVAWGVSLRSCNQSGILEVWQPTSNNITATDHAKTQRREFKAEQPVIVDINPF